MRAFNGGNNARHRSLEGLRAEATVGDVDHQMLGRAAWSHVSVGGRKHDVGLVVQVPELLLEAAEHLQVDGLEHQPNVAGDVDETGVVAVGVNKNKRAGVLAALNADGLLLVHGVAEHAGAPGLAGHVRQTAADVEASSTAATSFLRACSWRTGGDPEYGAGYRSHSTEEVAAAELGLQRVLQIVRGGVLAVFTHEVSRFSKLLKKLDCFD